MRLLVLVLLVALAESRRKEELSLLQKLLRNYIMESKQEEPQSVDPEPVEPPCGVESALTEEEVNEMLQFHNDDRKGEPASNMIRLSWSEELAHQAQEYADGCHYDHGLTEDCSGNKTGQNLFEGAGGTAGIFDPNTTMRSWFKEKEFYDLATDVCSRKFCGHYKQIVNALTEKVGCGQKHCDVLTAKDDKTGEKVQFAKDAVFVVCDYQPGTTFGDIYLLGEPCEKCPGGTKCVDGMCEPCDLETDNDCICPYKELCETSSDYVDYEYDCEYAVGAGDCLGGPYHDSAMITCAKSCNCELLKQMPPRCQEEARKRQNFDFDFGS